MMEKMQHDKIGRHKNAVRAFKTDFKRDQFIFAP